MAVCGVTLGLKPQTACFIRSSGVRPSQLRRVAPLVRCSAQNNDEKTLAEKVALPAAALLGAALLFAATPEDALAARSGGRVGGSSFSSRPRSAPPRASAGPTVRNYNYYSAPPLISPYGFSPFGFGMPFGGGVYVSPFGIGSIFNILIIMFMLNVVLNVVRNFTNADDNKNNKWSDDEDERW